MRTLHLSANGRSGVGQIILFDLVAVGLEQHRGAAQLADLLFGPFDHPVTLVGLLIKHLPAGRHLEALFGARLGLELGHLALLCGNSHGQMSGRPDFARLSVLIVHFPSPRQPFRPGGGRAALWQTRERNTTVTRILVPIQGSPPPPQAARPTKPHCSLEVHAGAYALLAALWRALCGREPGNARASRMGPPDASADRRPPVPFQSEFGAGSVRSARSLVGRAQTLRPRTRPPLRGRRGCPAVPRPGCVRSRNTRPARIRGGTWGPRPHAAGSAPYCGSRRDRRARRAV